MQKKDFTPEFITEEILDYIINQDFPNDELNEIGSIVRITGLSDTEISSVKKSQSNFIVDGTATVETETDMGDGDTSEHGYPMKFSYEFDENGKINKQLSRKIDTSSFFDGDDE